MRVLPHVLRATRGLSTGWALRRCFAWTFGTAAALAQGWGVTTKTPRQAKMSNHSCLRTDHQQNQSMMGPLPYFTNMSG